MNTTDFDEVVEHYHRALGEFLKGNPEPNKMMYSHQEDVTLANPYGPPVPGVGAGCGDDGACRIVTPRWRDGWHRDGSEVCDS